VLREEEGGTREDGVERGGRKRERGNGEGRARDLVLRCKGGTPREKRERGGNGRGRNEGETTEGWRRGEAIYVRQIILNFRKSAEDLLRSPSRFFLSR
jgi:hypothetical protein